MITELTLRFAFFTLLCLSTGISHADSSSMLGVSYDTSSASTRQAGAGGGPGTGTVPSTRQAGGGPVTGITPSAWNRANTWWQGLHPTQKVGATFIATGTGLFAVGVATLNPAFVTNGVIIALNGMMLYKTFE